MENQSFMCWSLRLWRTRTLEVRIGWFLLVMMLFNLVNFMQSGLWWMVPAALIIPPLVTYLHAMAHVGMARLVGGSADRTVLNLCNDQTSMSIPLTPAKQGAVAAAGPVVSLILMLGCAFALPFVSSHPEQISFWHILSGDPSAPLTYNLLVYSALWNGSLFFLNLLACAVFDGARLWRAALWPLFGLVRAVRWTVWLSYACSILLIADAVWTTSLVCLVFGIVCLIVTIQEHRSVRLGFDPVLQVEYETVESRRPRSWFAQWKARRRLRAELARDRAEQIEQETLDVLLVKVTEHGLTALTDHERRLLQSISRKQRERQETGIS